MWNFFERKVVLTVDDIEWCKGQEEFARVGLGDYQKFQALPDIGPHQSFSRSERQILSDFLESDAKTLLHLEDDCAFRELGHLEQALSELPKDWDIVYLGANIQCQPERYSEHLFRVSGAWTTHAIGYSRRPIQFILDNQPGFSEMMYDNWLSGQLSQFNAFVVSPMAAWQRSHYSIIWGRDVDYDDVFMASEEKLR